MAERITQLRAKRGIVKAQLTRLQNYYDRINSEILDQNIINQLNIRLGKIEPLLDEFNEIQLEIDIVEAESDDTEREQFENLYFSINSNVKTLCAKFESSKINNSPENSVVNGTNRSGNNNFVKLPTIKLPSFDGQYCNWLEFRDAFNALVDNNESISEIQKFYYLRSSLEKHAAQIIESIEISSSNYKNAWQILSDRFENKNLMIHNHIKAIIEYPHISKESHVELRKLLDSVTKNLRCLKTLGEQIDSWDRLMICIITNKFDAISRRDWESFKYDGELPVMSDLNSFLKSRCEVLEKLEISKNNRTDKYKLQSDQTYKSQASNSFLNNNAGNYKCYYCKQEHSIYKCNSFLNLSVAERIAEVKRLKLCLNCLRASHPSWNCSARKCLKCHRPHNSLLHLENTNPSETLRNNQTLGITGNINPTEHSNNEVPSQVMTQNSSLNNHISENNAVVTSQVLLSTALVKIRNRNGEFIKCRALLDSGSQSHFISKKLCKKLELQELKINHVVKGVGETFTNINSCVNLSITAHFNNFNINISSLIIDNITDKLPSMFFDKDVLNIPKTINLADPTFNVPTEIDILLGSDIFWLILCNGQKRLGQNMPILQNTKLGWIVAGNMSYNLKVTSSLACVSIHPHLSIDDNLERFWKIEEINNYSSKDLMLSESQKYCETHFFETTRRDSSGRFIVNIPFKKSLEDLGHSRKTALKRFYSLERRLNRDHNLKSEYISFMNEYERLNHMVEINEGNSIYDQGGNNNNFYLAHHAIIKESSLTTKCRVVFDASAKSDTGLSLNDVQFSGPTLQQDVFSILLRFRKYKYVLTGDISKMYRQILIDEDQRRYQRIFWRSNPNETLRCYELNTVTYGTTSAPYLAIRCLIQLANDNKLQYPSACRAITNDFYVDDLLTGANTVSEILQIQREIREILLTAGFELRKWLCNNREILNKIIVNDNVEASVLHIGENEPNKTLGIYWNPNLDFIQYSVKNATNRDQITKRTILSTVCQIFDPLGLLGPVVVEAKLILQELWKLKCTWDEPVPQNICLRWSNFSENLITINNLKIPRHVLISEYLNIELHGFCDSSERAYGSCVYIRCQTNLRKVSCNILCAKSRVAPLKQVSLPRLELCGALLLANLVSKTIESLDIRFNSHYFWTDSKITLPWIRGGSHKWKTFVANRVSEIRSLTEFKEWHHVRSSDNPADLISRGTCPQTLYNSNLWWHGPEWLLEENWYKEIEVTEVEDDIPEKRVNICMTVMLKDQLDIISKYSSLLKIQRVLAYIWRFIKNIQVPKEQRLLGVLSPKELDDSLTKILKTCQQESFIREYIDLVNNKEISKTSNILGLNPFMKDGLIRVGGRIQNSKESYDRKHPILLPRGHKVTQLILRAEHERLLHCGTQNLLCSVRERYWPISGRNGCKNVIKKCIICFKAQPKSADYIMGNLPQCRVVDYSPFQNVGTDFGGPFLLKDRVTRGPKIIKSYICIFVCMSTKAVHIELVSELSTRAFMACFKRFISRRGKPKNIYSDNGLNYVGANNELVKLYEFINSNANYITNQVANEQINWHFSPARSPSFGGIWEAGIKSTKHHIKRVVGNLTVTFEEMATILTQIESILNSRPLCPLSSDPEDLSSLTPAHFLIGKSLTALPENTNYMEVPENRLCKYQKLQAVIQHYWTRWQREYLSELQVRTKWKQRSRELLKIGTLVLIKEDNAPPLSWKLGRITHLYPGSDGVTRVVDIKVRGNELRRAVNRVCALPID